MELEQIVAAIASAREAIRTRLDTDSVQAFTKAINELGYVDYQMLLARDLRMSELEQEAAGYLRKILRVDAKDHVALNNLGVLLANRGESKQARPCFRAALKLAPQDRNIHENLRILDIVTRKPEARWHAVPKTAQPGEHTLVSYFDSHAM